MAVSGALTFLQDISFALVQAHARYQQLEQGYSLADLPSHATRAEYMELGNITNTKQHEKEFFDVNDLVMQRNRYIDIIPYTRTRVVLNAEPDPKYKYYDYINANYIRDILDENISYIASQGPTPQTVGHFWHMVWDQNVETIFMLCKVREGNVNKCAQYWPALGQQGNIGSEFELRLTAETGDTIIERQIEVTRNGETRMIRQIQYTSWPDHGVPSESDMRQDIRLLLSALANCAENPATPVIVHCSAGIGRTGTILALHMLIKLIKYQKANGEDPRVSIFSVVRRMREQRVCMVQTVEQYDMIYQYLSGVKNEF